MENQKNNPAWKRRLPWIAAIVLGTLSIMAVNKYLTLQQQGKEVKTAFLITAAEDIPGGHELTMTDLKIKEFPEDSASEVSVIVPGRRSAAAAEETNRKMTMLTGRKTTRQISAGQQIFWSDLATAEQPSFTSRIPANMRAVTIPVSPVTSVNNLVQPGDTVDIIFTSNTGEAGEAGFDSASLLVLAAASKAGEQAEAVLPETRPAAVSKSSILLSGIQVLAAGSNFRRENSEAHDTYSGVTLLVTPQEGVLLTHSLTAGQLSLMLRNASDTSISEAESVEAGTLVQMGKNLSSKRKKEVNHE